MPEKIPNQSLSIYLLKEGVTSEAKALKDKASLQERSVTADGAVIGTLYAKNVDPRKPRWLTFFNGALSPNLTVKNQSSGAVLLIKRKKRLFAITFGQGRHLLEANCWEDGFGLRVTLNSVEPDKIRSLDRVSFDALSRHTRTQASKEGDVIAFGHDVEQDLLRAVTGASSDATLGTRVTGSDSLKLTLPLEVKQLPALINHVHSKFESKDYKKNFSWIDHLSEVKDAATINELDAEVVKNIKIGSLDKIWLAVPEIIDWSQTGGFRYTQSTKDDPIPDIHLQSLLDSLRDSSTLSVDSLKNKSVYAFDTTDEIVTYHWPVYKCLYAELDKGSDNLLLSNGKWYRVDKNFVASVDGDVARLKPTSLPLPACTFDDEGAYNFAAQKADPANLALLDAKLISHGGGHSKIEVCDLLSINRKIVHVKHYSGSSVLSHLFAQGAVSATLLLQDPDFLKKAQAKLPASHTSLFATRPDPAKWEVAYAIISKSKKDINKALPFFSRLNLRNVVRTLEGFGFTVTLTKIERS